MTKFKTFHNYQIFFILLLTDTEGCYVLPVKFPRQPTNTHISIPYFSKILLYILLKFKLHQHRILIWSKINQFNAGIHQSIIRISTIVKANDGVGTGNHLILMKKNIPLGTASSDNMIWYGCLNSMATNSWQLDSHLKQIVWKITFGEGEGKREEWIGEYKKVKMTFKFLY